MGNRTPRSEGEPRDPIRPRSRVVVALVRGVHGLRGAVRVEVLTDRPEERFKPGQVVHREGSDDPLTIRTAVPVADGPGWRLQFREVPDRTAAERLRDAYLETELAREDALARGEYFWHEVIGCHVVDLENRELGVVRDVYRAGGAEVFVVSGGPIGEFDVPAVRAFIRIFAPKRGEIVIDAAALDLVVPDAPSS
jgi:16S rRNA processing protein RimM